MASQTASVVSYVQDLVTVKIHCPYSLTRPTRLMLCTVAGHSDAATKDEFSRTQTTNDSDHHDLSESDCSLSETEHLDADALFEDPHAADANTLLILPTGLEKVPYVEDAGGAAIGKACAVLDETNTIRLKLGGVCCDVNPAAIVHLIRRVTGVSVLGIDLFTRKHGCCSVWVRDLHERRILEKHLNERLWMGPPSAGFAVVAHTNTAAEQFARHLSEMEVRHVSFPRHLMTVTEYLKVPPPRRQPVNHAHHQN